MMQMPDFPLEEADAWLAHLRANGVVRIRGVLGTDDVEQVKSLWWDWLESLGGGAARSDPKTWTDANFPGLLDKGFFCTRAGGQSAAAWAIRGNRRVHEAFAKIWGEEDLITSLDTFIGWRPWWKMPGVPAGPKPRTEGIHCDQNPHNKRGLRCIQGMVPLRPVTPEVGGLCVAPESHTDDVQARLRELFPTTTSDDWIPVQLKYPEDDLCFCGELVTAGPGDLILWDSRALHGGYVGPGAKGELAKVRELPRLSFTVCMVPSSEASAKDMSKRQATVAAGATTTHWPLGHKKQAGKDSHGSALQPLQEWTDKFRPPDLDPWCQALVVGRALVPDFVSPQEAQAAPGNDAEQGEAPEATPIGDGQEQAKP